MLATLQKDIKAVLSSKVKTLRAARDGVLLSEGGVNERGVVGTGSGSLGWMEPRASREEPVFYHWARPHPGPLTAPCGQSPGGQRG